MPATRLKLITAVLVLLTIPWFSGGREPGAWLATALLLLIGLILSCRQIQSVRPSLGLVPVCGLGLAAWAGLSLIWSVNRFQTISWLIFYGLALAAFGLACQIRSEQKLVEVWIKGFLGVATATSLFGIWLLVVGEYDRLTSWFYWPNPLAIFIAPALLWAWWRFGETRRWYYALTAVINLAALVLADSRSIWLLLALLAVFLAFRIRRPAGFWLRIGLVVPLAILIVVGTNLGRSKLTKHQPVKPGSRFVEVTMEKSTSRDDRLYYLKSVGSIWTDYPLLGSGAGTFSTLHPKYQYRVISAGSSAHNFYAQTAAELGLIGGLLLAGLALGLLINAVRSFKDQSASRPLVIGLILVLVHFGLDIDSLYLTLWLLLAILAGLTFRPLKPERRPIWQVGLILVLIGLMLPIYSLYRSHRATAIAKLDQADSFYDTAATGFAKAHQGVAYNPDVIGSEGINYYSMAKLGEDKEANFRRAKQRADLAIKQDRLDGQHYLLLGRIEQAGQHYEAAAAAYRQAIELDPYNHPIYFYDLTTLLIGQGQVDEPLKRANQILGRYDNQVIANRHLEPNLKPLLARIHINRALLKLKQNQPSLAKADLVRSLKLEPKNSQAEGLLKQLEAVKS